MQGTAPVTLPRRGFRAVLVILMLALLSAMPDPYAAAAAARPGGATEADRMVTLLNQERTSRGLPPLQVLPRLSEMAERHSNTMGAGGAACGSPALRHNPRLDQQVQPASAWGENVACASGVEQMHQGLMNSPGHRANILGEQWNAVGIGTLDGRWSTQVFARVDAEELRAAAAPQAAPESSAVTRPEVTQTPAPEETPSPEETPTPEQTPTPDVSLVPADENLGQAPGMWSGLDWVLGNWIRQLLRGGLSG